MPAKLRKLQKKSKTPAGLQARRAKGDLESQLESLQVGSVNPTTDNENRDECKALLGAKINIGDEAEMKKEAKSSLGQALKEDEFYVEKDRGTIVVGNQVGLHYAGLPNEVASLEKLAQSEREKLARLKLSKDSLESRLNVLTLSIKSHTGVRNRFLSTYNRDILECPTDKDHKLIHEGNAGVHGGDVVADSLLYEGPNARDDFKSFESLYGLDPAIVGRLKRNATLKLLNLHATAVSSKCPPCDDHFFTLFKEFIKRFAGRDGAYKEDYLDTDPTEVTHAYWACFACHQSIAGKEGSCH